MIKHLQNPPLSFRKSVSAPLPTPAVRARMELSDDKRGQKETPIFRPQGAREPTYTNFGDEGTLNVRRKRSPPPYVRTKTT